MPLLTALLLIAGRGSAAFGFQKPVGDSPSKLPFLGWAKTPPMGWNSWDCFGTGVTEPIVRENAEYMAKNLKSHGWSVITIDIDWFVPGAKGWNYTPGAELSMDAYGRLMPAVDRFPSARDGAGFKPLASWIHGQGLKFGVHLLRGIPRKAVERNLPILGTNFHAGDIADKTNVCRWNPDMYGVDMSKPGAQEYYDSLLKLLAGWGVDFVKVDDLSTPYHESEIDAIRTAIDRSGRPIVLSTSPGPTGVEHGEHIETHANMWRVSNDFWDNWDALKEQFERLDRWTPYRGDGHWPDADMLPLGAVRQDEPAGWTHFTKTEQNTLISLWAICRSPLILGGNLPKNDPFTLSLLTNDEVIAVNQDSANNHQLWRKGDWIAWVADVPGTHDKYLAVFNAADQKSIDFNRASFASGLVTRDTPGQAVSVNVDIADAKKLYLYVDDGGDGNFGDHAVWAEPMLTGPRGFSRLTDIKWDSATQGYGTASVGKSVTGKPLILNGQPVSFGIGTHAKSMIAYTLPADFSRFTARAGLGQEGVSLDHGATVKFYVFTQDPFDGPEDSTAEIPVSLADLGLTGTVTVRDLWTHAVVGEFKDSFNPPIPWHGAGLYRLSPK
jgi:alpha-galactosidase